MKCSVEILETNNEALDEKPSDIAAGEKVIGGGALLTREVQAIEKTTRKYTPMMTRSTVARVRWVTVANAFIESLKMRRPFRPAEQSS